MLALSPFHDNDDENDFLGAMLVDFGTESQRLVIGELDRVWAGSGGGGGGDAVKSANFPLDPFTTVGDEKGAGAGGAGGGLRLLAIGDIIINWNGSTATGGALRADGGSGGAGENASGFDRIGGGSGGGSGGHIVLSSAGSIVIGGESQAAGSFYDDPEEGHLPRLVTAVGGEGGAGRAGQGGANQSGPRPWDCDAIAFPRFEGSTAPPFLADCFQSLACFTDPLGPVTGAGGDGGPGLIQLHVDDPEQNLRFPSLQDGAGLPTYGNGLDVTKVLAPPPVGWYAPQDADRLVPFFGKNSTAQSKWIALGLARVNPESRTNDPVLFRFGGVDSNGVVLRTGEFAELLDPILGPLLYGSGQPVFFESGALVLPADTLALEDEIYKRTAALLRRCELRFVDSAAPQNMLRTMVEAATYEFDDVAAVDRLLLTLNVVEQEVDAFASGAAGDLLVSLIPRYFEVMTSGVEDAYPDDASIRVTFDATTVDAEGNPSEIGAYSHPDGAGAGFFTPDIAALQAPGTPEWDYFRFRVEFDLNTASSSQGIDLSTPLPKLRFLRVPFEF